MRFFNNMYGYVTSFTISQFSDYCANFFSSTFVHSLIYILEGLELGR